MLKLVLASIAILALTISPAQGRQHHYRHQQAPQQQFFGWSDEAQQPHQTYRHRHVRRSHVARHRIARTEASHPFSVSAGISATLNSGSSIISRMRRDLGTNPTGWRRVWCAVYLRQVLAATGHSISGTDARAISFARYGHPLSGPQVTAIAVQRHHVFVVTRVLSNGVVEGISGNHGHRVGIGRYSTRSVIAWRAPA